MDSFPNIIEIRCDGATLRPLGAEHRDAILRIGLADRIWTHSTTHLSTHRDVDGYLEEAVDAWRSGHRRTFAVIADEIGFVGATALGNLSTPDRRVEIGWTWLGLDHQGTGVNTRVKQALINYCFGALGSARVEFKTDVLNARARQALKKIGAVEEGILRSHTLMPGGRRRDTIYYGILRAEWPLPVMRGRSTAVGIEPHRPS